MSELNLVTEYKEVGFMVFIKNFFGYYKKRFVDQFQSVISKDHNICYFKNCLS